VTDGLHVFDGQGESVSVRPGVATGEADGTGDMESVRETVGCGDADSVGVLDITTVPDRVALRQTGSVITGSVSSPSSFIT
jgi:hypothetical protein